MKEIIFLIAISAILIGCVGQQSPEINPEPEPEPEPEESGSELKECLYKPGPEELKMMEEDLEKGLGKGYPCETIEDCEEYQDLMDDEAEGEIVCEEVDFVKMSEVVEGAYPCDSKYDCIEYVYPGYDEPVVARYSKLVKCENNECSMTEGNKYFFLRYNQPAQTAENPPPKG